MVYREYDELSQEIIDKSLLMAPIKFTEYFLNNWDCRMDNLFTDYFEANENNIEKEDKNEIIRVMKDFSEFDDKYLREAVAKSLRYLCSEDVSLLVKFLSDSDVLVRCEALESLVKVAGAKVADKVVEIFRTDEDTLVRIIAIRQLAKIEGINLTDIFMEALETTDSEEIFSAACMALAERKNKKVYRFIRQNYIRARTGFDRVCLSYTLYLHGEKDKLKKICTALTTKGKENIYVRYEAAMFLDFIYWKSNYKTRKLILEALKGALPNEPLGMISGDLKISIENMEPDIEEYLQNTGKQSIARNK
jgi:hypothetical protein